MMDEYLFIEGPMHPDLFDGESPIMIKVPVKESCRVYCIDIEYQTTSSESYHAIGKDEDEAAEIACEQFTKEYSLHDDIEIIATVATEVTKGPGSVPSEKMVEEYLKFKDCA